VTLLEAINEQIKIMQELIRILYTQYLAEPGDPVKMNVLHTLNDQRAQELQNKVDSFIEKVKKLPIYLRRNLQQPRRQASRYSSFAQRVVEAKRGVAEINKDNEELPEVFEESL